nr:U11/U12 small nuclear ribonucleoprotein 65 kDa protein isoform X1 [Ipomoea batatas]
MATEETAATLLIRHLPEAIPPETLSRLFSHYGASSVRPCTHGSVKNCAFVDFKDEALAYQAQRQLNGLRFLGKILSVEKASKRTAEDKHGKSEPGTGKDSISLIKDGASYKDLDGTTLSYRRNEPIAQRLGLDYPFPPHLE